MKEQRITLAPVQLARLNELLTIRASEDGAPVTKITLVASGRDEFWALLNDDTSFEDALSLALDDC